MYDDALMIGAMKIWKLPAGKEGMLSEMCESGDYFGEEKIDGYWYEFERTGNNSYLFSRNTSVTTGLLSEKSDNVPHIVETLSCLPAGTIVIGEIYVPGGTSKNVTSIMGCLPAEAIKRQEKNGLIHYYLHDIIYYDGVNLMDTGAEDRYNILKAVWEQHNFSQYDFLRLATKVDDNIEAEISRILAMGGEGMVLKKRDYPYTPDKRPAWSTIKIKQMDSVDLVCMGTVPPTKEYTGKDVDTWQYWMRQYNDPVLGWVDKEMSNGPMPLSCDCDYRLIPITKYYYLGWHTAIKVGAYDKDGNLVELGTVASGLTDDTKRLMTEFPGEYVGKVVALDCMSIDKKSHTLRHPAVKCFRSDKPATDCKIEEIFA